jgi:fucose permease
MQRTSSNTAILGLNFAAMAQHGVILLLVGPVVPNLMATFAVPEGTAGILLSVGSLGFMAGPLIAGAVIDRTSVRWAFIIGLFIELAFLVLFGLSPLFFLAVAANFFVHLGSSFVETGANVLPNMIPRKRSAHSVMNLVHAFFSVGALAGPFLIGLYLDATGDWRPVFFFAMVPTAGLLLWTLAVRIPRGGTESSPPSNPFAHLPTVIRSRPVIFGAISLLLYVGAEIGISAWIVHYLQKELGFSTVFSASGLSIIWALMLVGRFLNSLIGNRFSSRTLVTVSGLGGAVGTVAFLFVNTVPAAYALLGWIGLCLAGVFPNVMAEINHREPERSGTVTAVMALGAAAGASMFQWLIGFLAEHVSLKVAFVTPAVLQALVVVSFAIALIPERRNTAPSDGRPV